MPRSRTEKANATNCELVARPALRRRVDSQTAQIAPDFPPGVARPALRALLAAGFTRLEQLSEVREADLADLHGMGPKALQVLRDALRASGRSFKR